MEDADRLDAVESASDRIQFQYIALRIFDIVQIQLACLSSRVGKAIQTDVDREQAGIWVDLRDLNRVQTSAATGDQNLQLGLLFCRSDGFALGLIDRKCG